MLVPRILSIAFVFLAGDIGYGYLQTGCFRAQVGRQERILTHAYGGYTPVCGGMGLAFTLIVLFTALAMTYFLWKIKKKP